MARQVILTLDEEEAVGLLASLEVEIDDYYTLMQHMMGIEQQSDLTRAQIKSVLGDEFIPPDELKEVIETKEGIAEQLARRIDDASKKSKWTDIEVSD